MKIQPFEFVLAALATYRLSLMWTKENGPAKIFKKIRQAPEPRSPVREWLNCILCFSMTISALMCGVLVFTGVTQTIADWFILWCALSAVTVVLNQRFTQGDL